MGKPGRQCGTKSHEHVKIEKQDCLGEMYSFLDLPTKSSLGKCLVTFLSLDYTESTTFLFWGKLGVKTNLKTQSYYFILDVLPFVRFARNRTTTKNPWKP